jgi:hypothetical protein
LNNLGIGPQDNAFFKDLPRERFWAFGTKKTKMVQENRQQRAMGASKICARYEMAQNKTRLSG